MNKTVLNSLFVLALGVSQNVFAGLDISPIQLFISEKNKQRSATVTLDSKGIPTQKIFEASAVKWSQDSQGQDVLEPDPSILINPKNFVIQPESSQVIRVGFAQAIDSMDLSKEKTWRIIFTEIPSVTNETSVNFLLNISIPLFVGTKDLFNLGVMPSTQDGNLILKIKNNADSHIKVTQIAIVDDVNNKEIANIADMKYLLQQTEYGFGFGNVKLSQGHSYTVKISIDKKETPIEIKIKG